MFNPVLKTPPAKEPVTLDELKSHSRVTTNAEDTDCEAMIAAAREWCESFANRTFITQTWDLYIDYGFPCTEIFLPKGPLQSITEIKYIDTDGVVQTLDPSKYSYSAKGIVGRLLPAYGETWPVCRPVLDAVQITAVCGFATEPADVPENIRQAVKLLAAHFYQNREGIIVGSGMDAKEIPLGIKSLLMNRKVFKV